MSPYSMKDAGHVVKKNLASRHCNAMPELVWSALFLRVVISLQGPCDFDCSGVLIRRCVQDCSNAKKRGNVSPQSSGGGRTFRKTEAPLICQFKASRYDPTAHDRPIERSAFRAPRSTSLRGSLQNANAVFPCITSSGIVSECRAGKHTSDTDIRCHGHRQFFPVAPPRIGSALRLVTLVHQSCHNLPAIRTVTSCMQMMIATQPTHPACFQTKPGRIDPMQPPR